MCESLALAGVIVTRSRSEDRRRSATDEGVVEVRLQCAGSVSVDEVKGGNIRNGDVIGGDADNWT